MFQSDRIKYEIFSQSACNRFLTINIIILKVSKYYTIKLIKSHKVNWNMSFLNSFRYNCLNISAYEYHYVASEALYLSISQLEGIEHDHIVTVGGYRA